MDEYDAMHYVVHLSSNKAAVVRSECVAPACKACSALQVAQVNHTFHCGYLRALPGEYVLRKAAASILH
jgi:hypothetical protein